MSVLSADPKYKTIVTKCDTRLKETIKKVDMAIAELGKVRNTFRVQAPAGATDPEKAEYDAYLKTALKTFGEFDRYFAQIKRELADMTELTKKLAGGR